MFFKIKPFIYSILMVALLEVVVFKEDWFWRTIIAILFFSFFVIWPFIRRRYILPIPLSLSLGAVTLLFLIDSFTEKQIFVSLFFIIYYFVILSAYRLKFYYYDQTAQSIINLATLVAIFFCFVCFYALFLNYKIETWFLLIVFFGTTFFIVFPSFFLCSINQNKKDQKLNNEIIEVDLKKIFFLDLLLSFLITQMIWGVIFWPFSYLTTMTVVLIIFYVFWDFIKSFISGNFLPKRIIINSILAVFMILIILLSAQWNLII